MSATISASAAAAILQITVEGAEEAFDEGLLPNPLTKQAVRALGKEKPAWLVERRLAERRTRQADRKLRRQRKRPAKAELAIIVPERRTEPESVVCHLGPTNSGKTYQALRFLVEHGEGVYAAPLRMLAQEAYSRLSAELGIERVGLRTGEERINDGAPILCCTVEMAPLAGETLVLDEVHWAADPERGSSWSRLIAAGEYRHIRLLGAVDAQPLIEAAFPQAEIIIHERLGPLDFIGDRKLSEVESGSVCIVFSRKAVLALAYELQQQTRQSVAVLYGSMPLAARRGEIERFVSGEAAFCVATDVLGHGVNLPCRTVLFAETDKYDGRQRRPLELWEIAQIAGRAGRFGHHDDGQVGVLRGLPWLHGDGKLVESALTPPLEIAPDVFGYRAVSRGRLRPQLHDLQVSSSEQLYKALFLWEKSARAQFAETPWLEVQSTDPQRLRLEHLNDHLRGWISKLSLDQAWTLANAPLDAELADDRLLLCGFADALIASESAVLKPLLGQNVRALALADAERVARLAAGLRWFALTFPAVGVTIDAAARLEEQASRRVGALIQSEVRAGKYGRCQSCGRSCAPWFSQCDRCFSSRRDHDW